MATKALTDITSEQTSAASSDLLFIEKTGTPAKITYANMLGTTLTTLQSSTAAGLALMDDADAAAQRTTLGLGDSAIADLIDDDTFATATASNVASAESIKAYVDARGGKVFLASSDASSDATLDFTAFTNSTYDAYEFVLNGVVPATDDVALYMRTSANAGSSYDSGASDYQYNNTKSNATGQVNEAGATAAQILLTDSDDTDVGSGAGEDGVYGTIRVFGAHLAKRTVVTHKLAYINASGAIRQVEGVGMRDASATVDAVQFLFSSGAIESGTITMYGLRNA